MLTTTNDRVSQQNLDDEIAKESRGTRVKRYLRDDSVRGYKVVEETAKPVAEATNLASLPALRSIKAFMLPPGFPNTVTADYLPYVLWSFPTHVTGWLYRSLTTASLLEGVGVSTSGHASSVVAATAAIRWITKDGLGALGRVVVGGRFANVVDEDPKRWRMVAEAFAVMGSFFELSTVLLPGQFLVLASMGTLSKAVGKGFGRPSFRVIQNHFAASNNVGAVAAKEEVWEVVAQLVGLSISVALLRNEAVTGSYAAFFLAWAVLIGTHCALRYISLSVVTLPVLNLRRAKMLVAAHQVEGAVPSVAAVNGQEAFLDSGEYMRPHVRLGCALDDTLQCHCEVSTSAAAVAVQEVLELYAEEDYVLAWSVQQARACVTLRATADTRSALRALWQATWLDRQNQRTAGKEDGMELLVRSRVALANSFPEVERQALAAGWRLSDPYLLPDDCVRLSAKA